MSDIILELRQIERSYASGKSTLTVLSGANLTLKGGELVGLIGPSGSGKSTLLHIAGLLERPQKGNVLFAGQSCQGLRDSELTRLRRTQIGFIYQFHHLLPEFSAEDNIAMPLMIGGVGRKQARAKAQLILQDMGLADRGHHQPGQLSGGEQQRVAIGRALVNQPKLVIADEPTGNLDPATTERVFASLINMVRSENVAILLATHNMALIPHMDRVITLDQGKLVDYPK